MPHNVSLPQNSTQHVTGREIFSFDGAALVTLGFYEPGKTATLNDPVFTGARFPNAVVAHELTRHVGGAGRHAANRAGRRRSGLLHAAEGILLKHKDGRGYKNALLQPMRAAFAVRTTRGP